MKSCSVAVIVSGSGSVYRKFCDLLRSRASFTISDLSPFSVLITFGYGLGCGFATLFSPINRDDYGEYACFI